MFAFVVMIPSFARRCGLAALVAVAALLAAMEPPAVSLAATLTWDVDGTSGGATGGTGTWNTTNTFWDNAGSMQAWNNAASPLDVAYFGGSAGTVTLNTGITAGGLTLATTGYTVTGGTLTLAANSAVAANTGITGTISSVIASTGTITKSGDGFVRFNGTNTFTGLKIDAGTVQVTTGGRSGNNNLGSATSRIILNGGTLATGASTTTVEFGDTRTLELGATDNVINGTWDAGTAAYFAVRTGLAGTGNLIKRGSGGVALFGNNSSWTGNITVDSGYLRFNNNDNNWGSASNTVTFKDGTGFTMDMLQNVTLQASRSIVLNSGTVYFNVGTGYILTVNSSLSGDGGFRLDALPAGGSGNGYLVLGGSNTFKGGLIVTGGSRQLRVAGTLDSDTAVAGFSYAGPIDIGSGCTFTYENADSVATQQLTGAISGAGTLTKSGASVLQLTGTSSFTGTFNNTGGEVRFASLADSGTSSALGASGTLRINGGTFVYTGTGHSSNRLFSFGIGSGTTNQTGLTLRANGSGALNLTNTGSTSWGAGGTREMVLGGTSTALNTYAPLIGDNTFNSVTYAASLVKSDVGTWVVTGSNNYTGGTTIGGGTLVVGNTSALGASTGSLAVNAGTLDLNGRSIAVGLLTGSSGATITSSTTGAASLTINSASSGTFGGTITAGSGSLAFVKQGNGTLTLSGSNGYTGGTTISGGTLGIGHSSALGTGAVRVNAGTLDLRGNSVTIGLLTGSSGATITSSTIGAITLTVSSTTSGTFGGVIAAGSGSLSLVKQGAGLLGLDGVNTFSGSTAIQAGSLVLGSSGSLVSSLIKVDSGAVFNTSAVTGGFTLAGGQTLAGNGSVIGNVTVASNATLAPGASPGVLAMDGVQNWQGGGNYNWQIYTVSGGAGTSTGWDLIDSTGSLDITATSGNPFNINLWSLSGLPDTTGNVSDFDPNANASFLIARFDGGITGFDPTKFNLNFGATNGTGGFTNTYPGAFSLQRVIASGEEQIVLIYAAVPEPGTLTLAGIGLAAIGWTAARRRRRRCAA